MPGPFCITVAVAVITLLSVVAPDTVIVPCLVAPVFTSHLATASVLFAAIVTPVIQEVEADALKPVTPLAERLKGAWVSFAFRVIDEGERTIEPGAAQVS